MASETRFQIPAAFSGFERRPVRSEVEVVIPEATTNLIRNPGFERSTLYWSVPANTTLARVTGDVYRGAFAALCTFQNLTGGAGFYYGPLPLTAGQAYTLSVRVKGIAGQALRIFFADTSGNALATKRFTATGRWQYVTVTWIETTTTDRRVYIAKDTSNISTQPIRADDVQVEAKTYPTTYCDGDMRGFVRGRADYTWSGIPHQSTSSRSAVCGSGGRVVNLAKFGLKILGMVGLGWGAVQNLSTPILTGGAIYRGSYQLERQFTVAGLFDGRSQDIRRRRAQLAAALHPNRAGLNQPVMLHITPIEAGRTAGDTLEIPVLYESGLQSGPENDYQDRVTLTFSAYQPYLSTGRNQSAAVPWQTGIDTYGGQIIARKDGGYTVIPTGMLGNAIKWNHVDGRIYAFSGTNPYAIDPATGAATLLSGHALPATLARAIEVTANGDVLYGVGNTFQRYRLSTSDWGTVVSANNIIEDIAVSRANGYIAVVGQFTTFNSSGANRVVVSTNDGATWSALGAGADGTINTAAWSLDGDMLYVGGLFNNFAGNSSQRFAYWSMSVGGVAGLPLMVSTFTGEVNSIAVTPDGAVYVGGNLVAALGVCPDYALVKFARTWPPLAVGMATTSGSEVDFLEVGPDGQLYVGFNAGGFAGIAGWPGQRAIYSLAYGGVRMFTAPFDIDTGFGVGEGTLTFGPNGDAAVRLEQPQNTYLVSPVLMVQNESSTDTWPTVIVDGPAVLRRIVNETTGVSIDLYLTVSAGERVYAEFAPDGFKLYSATRPNLAWAITPGASNATSFKLTPGPNQIRIHMTSDPVVSGGFPAEWSTYAVGNVTADNSDSGRLYVSITDMGGGYRQALLYKDAARTQLVAQSGAFNTAGDVGLLGQNGSGITGYLQASASPPTVTATMVLQFGLSTMSWPIVHDSLDAAVE